MEIVRPAALSFSLSLSNARPSPDKARIKLAEKMDEKHIEGFPEIVCAPSVTDGMTFLVNAKGLGVLRPNTVRAGAAAVKELTLAPQVMLGWPTARLSDREANDFTFLTEHIALSKKTLLVYAR
jgi:hypothetical protein